jgi:uncharacterized protein (DUF2461 family)
VNFTCEELETKELDNVKNQAPFAMSLVAQARHYDEENKEEAKCFVIHAGSERCYCSVGKYQNERRVRWRRDRNWSV